MLKLIDCGAALFRSTPKRAIVRAINPFNEPFRGEVVPSVPSAMLVPMKLNAVGSALVSAVRALVVLDAPSKANGLAQVAVVLS